MAKINLDLGEVRFHSPPQNEGQIVEVSYGADDGAVYKRSFDRSDRSVTYYRAQPSEDELEARGKELQMQNFELRQSLATCTAIIASDATKQFEGLPSWASTVGVLLEGQSQPQEKELPLTERVLAVARRLIAEVNTYRARTAVADSSTSDEGEKGEKPFSDVINDARAELKRQGITVDYEAWLKELTEEETT